MFIRSLRTWTICEHQWSISFFVCHRWTFDIHAETFTIRLDQWFMTRIIDDFFFNDLVKNESPLCALFDLCSTLVYLWSFLFLVHKTNLSWCFALFDRISVFVNENQPLYFQFFLHYSNEGNNKNQMTVSIFFFDSTHCSAAKIFLNFRLRFSCSRYQFISMYVRMCLLKLFVRTSFLPVHRNPISTKLLDFLSALSVRLSIFFVLGVEFFCSWTLSMGWRK